MRDDTLITSSPTSLEQLERIVTDVGRAPWLWGHAVTFELERPSHRVLHKTDGTEWLSRSTSTRPR